MGYTSKHLEIIKLFKNLKWEEIDIIELGSQDISMPINLVTDFIYSFHKKPKEIKQYITNNYTRLSSKFLIYKKIVDEEFKLPIQNKFNEMLPEINHFENTVIIERIEQLTNIDLSSIKNFAIFGTGQSGSRAYKFALKLDLNIICFVDDYKMGNYEDTEIPIVSFDVFTQKYSDLVKLMIIGNGQTGNIDKRDELKIDILELSNLFLNSELLK